MNPDGSTTPTLVMEHKTTAQLPAFLIKAIAQDAVNRKLYPDAPTYIGVTYHAPGNKVHRLLIKVVSTNDEWEEGELESLAA